MYSDLDLPESSWKTRGKVWLCYSSLQCRAKRVKRALGVPFLFFQEVFPLLSDTERGIFLRHRVSNHGERDFFRLLWSLSSCLVL